MPYTPGMTATERRDVGLAGGVKNLVSRLTLGDFLDAIQEEVNDKQRVVVSLMEATANDTTYYGVFVAKVKCRIKAAKICYFTAPASSAGTVLGNLYCFDGSSDNRLNETADLDLEGLTDKVATDLGLQTTSPAYLDLEAGHYAYYAVVSDNADLADGEGGYIELEIELLDPTS